MQAKDIRLRLHADAQDRVPEPQIPQHVHRIGAVMMLMRGSLGSRSKRKRTDSGSATQRTGARRSGTTPPKMKTEDQPKAGTSRPATRPPSAAPREKPQNMVMTMMAWWRFGLYSEMSAMAFGMAAPRPMPVMNRMMRSCCR